MTVTHLVLTIRQPSWTCGEGLLTKLLPGGKARGGGGGGSPRPRRIASARLFGLYMSNVDFAAGKGLPTSLYGGRGNACDTFCIDCPVRFVVLIG